MTREFIAEHLNTCKNPDCEMKVVGKFLDGMGKLKEMTEELDELQHQTQELFKNMNDQQREIVMAISMVKPW